MANPMSNQAPIAKHLYHVVSDKWDNTIAQIHVYPGCAIAKGCSDGFPPGKLRLPPPAIRTSDSIEHCQRATKALEAMIVKLKRRRENLCLED